MRYLKGLVSLVALGIAVTNQAHPQGIAGLKFTVGIKGGFPLTDPYADVQRVGMVQETALPNVVLLTPTIETGSQSKDYVVGPTVELFLPFHLSVEADGLYRPVTIRQAVSFQNLPVGPPLDIVPTGPILSGPPADTAAAHQDSSWEVSLLPKFHIPVPVPLLQPYIAGGPSFRVTSVPFLSNNGITAAAGVNLHAWKLHAGPEFRFTHWSSDSYPAAAGSTHLVQSNQNQLELLLSLSF